MMGRQTFWRKAGLLSLLMVLGMAQAGLAEERYVVRPGDTLSGISRAFGVGIERLREINHLKGDGIRPRQTLVIPPRDRKQSAGLPPSSVRGLREEVKRAGGRPSGEMDSYVVQKGDSLYSIAKRRGLSVEEIKNLNRLQSSYLRAGQTLILSTQNALPEVADEEAGDAADEEVIDPISDKAPENGEATRVLGKWANPEERNLLVRLVKTFLGAPYRLGGSTLKGIDCSAFVRKIYEVFNVHLPRTAREQLGFGMGVKKEELKEGDLVFFKTRAGRASNTHVGIYIGNDEFVHASSRNKEVKIDSLNAPYFSSRFLKGVRLKALETEL